MLTKIVAAGVVAALAIGFASAASARDYDDILKDRGIYAYADGAPFPYSEYGQSRGYQARAQALHVHRYAAPAQREMYQSAPQQSEPDRW